MKGFVADIENLTEENREFRHVLYTGKNLQLVLMALKPGDDICVETHKTHDQFFRIEEGKGEVTIDGITHKVKSGTGILVPAGTLHNLKNTGTELMTIYTLYGPPNHVDKLVQGTKAMALASSEHFDGKSTE
ncbi:cupin domain-containing protein [Phaeovulum sp.]|uniref:cupin domain-containing protein n=1 Tax=Phaeovulum sp. TaxID=2934796 RepID=UPI002AB96E16|nr:cupin domain-containing protein [Phaeovulum sp.]MDZ4117923.1 cupin domain-containing protein [Phaeovulum sp.]